MAKKSIVLTPDGNDASAANGQTAKYGYTNDEPE
jgi:hypothetical protein